MTIAEAERVTINEGVVFGTGGGRNLRCDVFVPPAAVRKEVGILLVHGGGWSGGDRGQLRGYGVLLGRKGYLCVASEYRLTGESAWPAQVHDVKAALRWMRANAHELGFDPAKLVIEGNSAGGHLSLLAAGTPGRPEFEGEGGHPGVDTSVAAAIAFYPPVDLAHRKWGGIPRLFGEGASRDVMAGASPVTWVTREFPPTLLIHGGADEVVPPGDSTQMYEALVAAGATAELHMYANEPHGFDASPRLGRQCADIMGLFLERLVGE